MDIETLQEELDFARSEGDWEAVAELSEALRNAWLLEMDEPMWDDCFYDGPEFY